MSAALKLLGLTNETAKKIEIAEVKEGKQILPAGIYNGAIKTLCVFNGSSEPIKMAKIVYEAKVDDGEPVEMTDYINVVKKDGTSNDIGARVINMIVQATGSELTDVEVQEKEEKCYGSKQKVQMFTSALNKPVTLFIRKIHEEGATFPEYNEVSFVGNPAGENSEGKDQKELFLDKIEKIPVIERKAKESTTTAKSTKDASSSNAKDLL
jgi:hypothetical protein